MGDLTFGYGKKKYMFYRKIMKRWVRTENMKVGSRFEDHLNLAIRMIVKDAMERCRKRKGKVLRPTDLFILTKE